MPKVLVKVAAPGESEDEHINDILDQLMGLHRADVKKRETDMTEARDLPVLHSNAYVVVSMADGGYAACATRLLETVRGAGRWGGKIVMLVPVGDGSVPLEAASKARLRELGAELLEVPPDSYGAGGGSAVRGAGAASQYAKVRLLEDEAFRAYDSVLFLDADGVVGAPLQPLLELELPDGRAVAMPTWPTTRQKHDSFYNREVNFKALEASAAQRLREEYPDRTLVGITAWFLLKPRLLPPPSVLRSQVDAALEAWRPGFRFNDQGLWNVLFYRTAAFYPLCISGPDPAVEGSAFMPLVVDSLDGLGAAIDGFCGPGHERRRPMYDHPRKDCLPKEEWERKKKANKDLSDGKRQDLLGAYNQNNLGRRPESNKHGAA